MKLELCEPQLSNSELEQHLVWKTNAEPQRRYRAKPCGSLSPIMEPLLPRRWTGQIHGSSFRFGGNNKWRAISRSIFLSVVDHICVNSSMFDWAHGEAIGNHWITLVLLLGSYLGGTLTWMNTLYWSLTLLQSPILCQLINPGQGWAGPFNHHTIENLWRWCRCAATCRNLDDPPLFCEVPCSTLDSRIASSYHGSPLGCQQNLWDQPKPPSPTSPIYRSFVLWCKIL